MPEKFEWTTADFETMSWHDCHVHGFGLEQREYGTADVAFDLDFILEWRCHDDGRCEFLVAPATLTFHRVFGLRVELDYARVSAGMCPFSISGIEREPCAAGSSFKWLLPINWPSGVITFESPGFTQVLRRPPLLLPRQDLNPDERCPHGDP